MKVVSVDKFVNINVVTTRIRNPIIASHLTPNRSNSLPVIGFIIPIIMALGSSANPESNAEKPSIFCINNGKITAVPIIETNTIIPNIVVMEKILYLNILNCNIGCSNFNCLKINMTREIAPIINEIATCKLDQPTFPAILNPYKIPPKPNVDKIIDNTSTFG